MNGTRPRNDQHPVVAPFEYGRNFLPGVGDLFSATPSLKGNCSRKRRGGISGENEDTFRLLTARIMTVIPSCPAAMKPRDAGPVTLGWPDLYGRAVMVPYLSRKKPIPARFIRWPPYSMVFIFSHHLQDCLRARTDGEAVSRLLRNTKPLPDTNDTGRTEGLRYSASPGLGRKPSILPL